MRTGMTKLWAGVGKRGLPGVTSSQTTSSVCFPRKVRSHFALKILLKTFWSWEDLSKSTSALGCYMNLEGDIFLEVVPKTVVEYEEYQLCCFPGAHSISQCSPESMHMESSMLFSTSSQSKTKTEN